MWADLDCEYRRLRDEENPAGAKSKDGRSLLLLAFLLLSLGFGGLLGASPSARLRVQSWLWDAHESLTGTWVLAIRTLRECASMPMTVDLLSVRGTLIAVGVFGVTVMLATRVLASTK